MFLLYSAPEQALHRSMPFRDAATFHKKGRATRPELHMSLLVAVYLLVRDTFFFVLNFVTELIAFLSLLISSLL